MQFLCGIIKVFTSYFYSSWRFCCALSSSTKMAEQTAQGTQMKYSYINVCIVTVEV